MRRTVKGRRTEKNKIKKSEKNKEKTVGEEHDGPTRVFTIEKEADQENNGPERIEVNAKGNLQPRNFIAGCGIVHFYDQPSTSESELKVSRLEKALQRLRKIMNDRNIEEWQTSVIEEHIDLEQPLCEVHPKLLKLFKFYEGELLKMKSQYQKDHAFTCGSAAPRLGEALDYDTFLDLVIETQVKRISVIGQAGSGKTVMMRKLVRDLSKHNKDLLIFFLHFRDFADSEEITPRNLLFCGFLDETDSTLSYEWILENQDQVVFVLDGLDQAAWSVDDKAKLIGPYGTGTASEIMSNIFMRKLFSGVKVVYTSREHAVASLARQLRPKMVVALTGLSFSDSELLFKSFIGNDGEMLWEKLRMQSHSLIPLLSIPAYLFFTAIVYKSNPENSLRFTTEVLQQVLEIFMQSGHIIREDSSAVIAGLKKMSFLGMRDGKVLFYIVDVQNAGLDPDQIRNWIIKIPGRNRWNQFLLEGKLVFFFSHQIIQEFLAAQYISEMDFESFKEIVIQHLKIDNNWSVVTRFLSGLLLNEEISVNSEVTDVEAKRSTLMNLLAEKYSLLEDRNSPLELLAAISESNHCTFIRNSVHDINIGGHDLNASGAYTVASLTQHLLHVNEVNLSTSHLKSEALQILWGSIAYSSLKIFRFKLIYNKLQAEAFTVIGKISKKCSVNELMLAHANVTNEAFGNLLSACGGATIMKLDICSNELEETGYATLGKFVRMCSVFELILCTCNLSDGKLNNFLLETEGAKISKLDISGNKLEDMGYATLGKIVKLRAVDELLLRHCGLTDSKLKNFYSEAEGAKISKLDMSFNGPEDTGMATLGKIVKMCTVDELCLAGCELTDEKLKRLLFETAGAQISKLNTSGNDLEEKGYATLGKIVTMCSVDELSLLHCDLSAGKLNHLLSEIEEAKMSKLDISFNKLDDLGYATLGKIVKLCAVEELKLEGCRFVGATLKNLLSEVEGAKIPRLDVSDNYLNDEDTAAILGDIVKRCSVEKLRMHQCRLTDESLETMLSRADGAKLSYIDVTGFWNHLSGAVLDKIGRILTVKSD